MRAVLNSKWGKNILEVEKLVKNTTEPVFCILRHSYFVCPILFAFPFKVTLPRILRNPRNSNQEPLQS